MLQFTELFCKHCEKQKQASTKFLYEVVFSMWNIFPREKNLIEADFRAVKTLF